MRHFVFLVLFFEFSGIRAQSTNELKVEFSIPKIDEQFKLEVLRFYVTNIQLTQYNSPIFKEKESYHLIDIVKGENSFVINYPENIQFDNIQFDLGVDSLTNVSGVYSGDLYPTKGMYWTWQSGYINFKIEGKHPESNGRKNDVQFHLGGYLPGQFALQPLKFNCAPPTDLKIQFDINSFLESMDFSKEHIIMSPGEKAVKLSQQLASYFKFYE